MGLSSAQKIGVGALMGGVASVGTSMLLRYFADNKGTAPEAGGEVDFPVLWEHAPLIGILGGGLATILTYYLFNSVEAAVACGMTALVAGVAPEADAWITEARAEKDLEEQKTEPGDRPEGRMRGSDVVDLKARVARLESVLEDRIAA